MEMETVDWEEAERNRWETSGKDPSEIQLECLLRNAERQNLVAPLRDAHAPEANAVQPREQAEENRRAALALQEQWNTWLAQRDLLRTEIKRGKECLEQIEKELAALRVRLEEWPSYERHCGVNPLLDYAQSISAKERLQKFLPDWIRRREQQLAALTGNLERCAKQNGLEHLL